MAKAMLLLILLGIICAMASQLWGTAVAGWIGLGGFMLVIASLARS